MAEAVNEAAAGRPPHAYAPDRLDRLSAEHAAPLRRIIKASSHDEKKRKISP